MKANATPATRGDFAVKNIEINDFMGRYAEGHPNTSDQDNRYYEGSLGGVGDQKELLLGLNILGLLLLAQLRSLKRREINWRLKLKIPNETRQRLERDRC